MANEGTLVTEFDEYKVTNGSVQWIKQNDGSREAATKLGCVGKLETETEVKTVTKKCEGVVVAEYNIPQKMTGTFTGKMPVAVLRRGFGIKTDGLKKGVYGYGTSSVPSEGTMTFDVFDLFEEVQKMLAFPISSFSGGLKWSLENGSEEFADVEISLLFVKDSNNFFYYEAFTSEVDNDEVKEKWHTEFTPELVKEEPPTPK
ncbi:phage tail protein [Listeria booriae]|uniref:phage tail protein n=1 Tax=Listeria booriae TaxID=1552123 RepID=UPI0021ADD26E|nr:phage tail protein [Listeria booriae]